VSDKAKNTRRTITVSGETYKRLRKFCDAHDVSTTALTEAALARVFDGGKVPAEAIPPAPPAPVVAVPESVDMPGHGRPAPVPYEAVVSPRPRGVVF
jgi:hypothetical protein